MAEETPIPPPPDATPPVNPAANLPPVPQPKPKRGWTPGDIVLRGLLAALSLLLVLEWTSQRNYGRTLEEASATIEAAEDRGLEGDAAKTVDVVAAAHGWYWESIAHAGHLSVTELRWPSFFKDYRIRILTDDEGSVMALRTANPEADEPVAEAEGPADEADVDDDIDAGPTLDELPVPDLPGTASDRSS